MDYTYDLTKINTEGVRNASLTKGMTAGAMLDTTGDEIEEIGAGNG